MQLPRLKEWRESYGLLQKELASEAGLSEFTITRIESGDSIRPSTARKVAGALGVSVADLMEQPPVPLGETLREAGLTKEEEEADAFAEAVLREIETHGRTGSFKEIIARVAQRELALPKQATISKAETPEEGPFELPLNYDMIVSEVLRIVKPETSEALNTAVLEQGVRELSARYSAEDLHRFERELPKERSRIYQRGMHLPRTAMGLPREDVVGDLLNIDLNIECVKRALEAKDRQAIRAGTE